MKADKIWEAANEQRYKIQKLVGETDPATVDKIMRSLKAMIPCLCGYDDKAPALVFTSEDHDLVALYFAYDEGTDTLVLALQVDIKTE